MKAECCLIPFLLCTLRSLLSVVSAAASRLLLHFPLKGPEGNRKDVCVSSWSLAFTMTTIVIASIVSAALYDGHDDDDDDDDRRLRHGFGCGDDDRNAGRLS